MKKESGSSDSCCKGSGPALALAVALTAALVGVALRTGAGLLGEELARMAWGEEGAGPFFRRGGGAPPVSVVSGAQMVHLPIQK